MEKAHRFEIKGLEVKGMVNKKYALSIISIVLVGSVSCYYLLGDLRFVQTADNKTPSMEFINLSAEQVRDKRILEIQDELRADKQNADLWYALGHAYMFDGQYDNALIVYDYAIRLTSEITSDHYSSKASAMYYINGQKLSNEIKQLLGSALAINSNNETALMMLAGNAFIKEQYQQAIDLWVQLLDSGQAGVDRVAVIDLINQAKMMMQ
jgi:formate-dependent nitrite reductase complex subunit NrfG